MTDEHTVENRPDSQPARPGRLSGRVGRLTAESRMLWRLVILILLGGAILLAWLL